MGRPGPARVPWPRPQRRPSFLVSVDRPYQVAGARHQCSEYAEENVAAGSIGPSVRDPKGPNRDGPDSERSADFDKRVPNARCFKENLGAECLRVSGRVECRRPTLGPLRLVPGPDDHGGVARRFSAGGIVDCDGENHPSHGKAGLLGQDPNLVGSGKIVDDDRTLALGRRRSRGQKSAHNGKNQRQRHDLQCCSFRRFRHCCLRSNRPVRRGGVRSRRRADRAATAIQGDSTRVGPSSKVERSSSRFPETLGHGSSGTACARCPG